MTSVVGISDSENDCGCQVVNSINLVGAKSLLARLQLYIHIILLRDRHILRVKEKCEEILYIINSDGFWEEFCGAILNLTYYLLELSNELFYTNPFISYVLYFIAGNIATIIYPALCY